jgi:hypothetical protein
VIDLFDVDAAHGALLRSLIVRVGAPTRRA